MCQFFFLSFASLTYTTKNVLKLSGFLIPAHQLLSNQICDERNLDPHATFLKFVATVGEVSLGIKHLQWIRDNYPLMLPALHEKLIAMASCSSELDPLLDFFRENHGAEGGGHLVPLLS